MNDLLVRRITTVLGLTSLIIWIFSFILLANGNKSNREEILKSRLGNTEGRAQVLEAINNGNTEVIKTVKEACE